MDKDILQRKDCSHCNKTGICKNGDDGQVCSNCIDLKKERKLSDLEANTCGVCEGLKYYTSEVNALYRSYKNYDITLRTWLIAYGVGGPFLVVSQKSLWEAIAPKDIKIIAIFFLSGILLQVVYTMINKWSQWAQYIADIYNEKEYQKEKFSKNYSYKKPNIAIFVSEAYFIDLFADLGAILCFGIATFLLVTGVNV